MNYDIPYSPTKKNNNFQRINISKKYKIEGNRKILKGGNNNNILYRIDNKYITDTIKTNIQFDNFLKKILKKLVSGLFMKIKCLHNYLED